MGLSFIFAAVSSFQTGTGAAAFPCRRGVSLQMCPSQLAPTSKDDICATRVYLPLVFILIIINKV